MRVHYVLNHGGTPESKLADVEIHSRGGYDFDQGPAEPTIGRGLICNCGGLYHAKCIKGESRRPSKNGKNSLAR